MPTPNNFHPDVAEIISRPPNWIVRLGNGLLLSFLLVLIALCNFIEYPDVIHADVKVVFLSGRFEGIGKIQRKGAGKVLVKQQVNIRIDEYPYQEFGILNGQIEKVSNSTEEDYYEIKISLPKQLMTSHGLVIASDKNLEGKAEIITNNVTLMDRFFAGLKKSFQVNKNQ